MRLLKPFLAVFVALMLIAVPALRAEDAPRPGRSELKILIKEVLLNNPQIVSAWNRYEAELAKVPQAGALSDPWVGVEYEQIPRGTANFNEAPMRMYSVSQEIPFPTKLITRAAVQREKASSAYNMYKEKERQIISMAKKLYAEIFLLYKAIDINNENKAILEQLGKAAATRFSVGKASQQDALKAHVEIAKIDNELIMLEQKRQVAVARLNILLNRSPDMELTRPEVSESAVDLKPVDEYYIIAESTRPELEASRSEVKMVKAMRSLARQEYMPDLMVEAKQREENSKLDGWDAMLKVKVPLYFMQKQNFGLKEANRELKMQEAEYEVTRNATLLEVKEAHSMASALLKLSVLYKTSFIPQAEQTFKASLTGYESAASDFLNLLDSQRMLLDFKLDYYGVLVDLEIAKSDLEGAVGTDLF